MSAQNYDIGRMLEEMRADYWRNLETAESDLQVEATEYLVVLLNQQRYGLPASSCREVLKVPRIIKVPRLPDHLLGIVNLRGEIVAVTDLRTFFRHEPLAASVSSRLVIVEQNGLKTALLVDGIDGLMTVADDVVEPLAEGAAEGARDLVRGKVTDDLGLLVLIDLSGLLQRPEMVVDQKAGSQAHTVPDAGRGSTET